MGGASTSLQPRGPQRFVLHASTKPVSKVKYTAMIMILFAWFRQDCGVTSPDDVVSCRFGDGPLALVTTAQTPCQLPQRVKLDAGRNNTAPDQTVPPLIPSSLATVNAVLDSRVSATTVQSLDFSNSIFGRY